MGYKGKLTVVYIEFGVCRFCLSAKGGGAVCTRIRVPTLVRVRGLSTCLVFGLRVLYKKGIGRRATIKRRI